MRADRLPAGVLTDPVAEGGILFFGVRDFVGVERAVFFFGVFLTEDFAPFFTVFVERKMTRRKPRMPIWW